MRGIAVCLFGTVAIVLAIAARAADHTERITADALLNQATQAAREIAEPLARAETLVAIARAQGFLIDATTTKSTLSLAFQDISLIKDASKQCNALEQAVRAAITAADAVLAAWAASEFWHRLEESSGRGWLGVWHENYFTPDATRQPRPDQLYGALITRVAENSPASTGGLEEGDVIVAVNGAKVAGSNDLLQAVGPLNAGARVDINLIRDGEKKSLALVIGLHPDSRRSNDACRGTGIDLLSQVATLQAGLEDMPASATTLRKASLELTKLPPDMLSALMRAPLVATTYARTGNVVAALDLAATIPDAVERVRTLVSIAGVAETNAADRAAAFGQAVASAKAIADMSHRSLALRIVAEAQIRMHDIGEARTTVAAIEDHWHAAEAAIALAEAETANQAAAAMTFRDALAHAVKIGDASRRLETVERIASAAEKIGHLPELLAVVAQLDNPKDKISIVERIVLADLARDDAAGAITAAALLPDASTRAKLMPRIAVAQAGAGNVSAAFRTVGSTTDPLTRVTIYTAAAKHYAQAGRPMAARLHLDRATVILKSFGQAQDGRHRDTTGAWTRVVEAAAALGDIRGARQAALQIDEPFFRVVALNEHVLPAQERLMANRSDLRETVHDIVMATAQISRDASLSVIPDISAARLLLQLGEAGKAREIIDRLPDGGASFRLESLITVVQLQAKTGNTADALATLDKMRTTIAKDDTPSWRASALNAVARTQAEIGDVSGAQAWSRTVPTPLEQAHALVGAAEGAKERRHALPQLRLDSNLRVYRLDKPATGADKEAQVDRALDQRIAALGESIRRTPRDAEAYAERAVLYEARHRSDLALADYGKVIDLYPRVTQGYIARAKALQRLKHYDRAIADANRAVTIDPQDDSALYLLGTLHFARSDADRAIAAFRRALSINPRLVVAYAGRGAAYATKRDFPAALTDYSEAIRLDPINARYANARAWTFVEAGTPARGLADANRALLLEPDNADALDTRAHIHEAAGERVMAIEGYRRALSLKPDLRESQLGLKRLGATP